MLEYIGVGIVYSISNSTQVTFKFQPKLVLPSTKKHHMSEAERSSNARKGFFVDNDF